MARKRLDCAYAVLPCTRDRGCGWSSDRASRSRRRNPGTRRVHAGCSPSSLNEGLCCRPVSQLQRHELRARSTYRKNAGDCAALGRATDALFSSAFARGDPVAASVSYARTSESARLNRAERKGWQCPPHGAQPFRDGASYFNVLGRVHLEIRRPKLKRRNKRIYSGRSRGGNVAPLIGFIRPLRVETSLTHAVLFQTVEQSRQIARKSIAESPRFTRF